MRRSPQCLLLLMACVSLGCSSNVVQQAGIPGTSAPATIVLLAERSPLYLDVHVSRGGKEWRYFVPSSDACRSVIAEGDVRYTQSGPLGALRGSGDLRCDPNGILSLQLYRDQTSRSRPPGVPSGLASYEIHYRDDDLALAVGRFPMVGYVGWSGGEHTVAILPNSEACAGVLERKNATIEYRASGPVPLALVTKNGRCPLLGLARAN